MSAKRTYDLIDDRIYCINNGSLAAIESNNHNIKQISENYYRNIIHIHTFIYYNRMYLLNN